MRLLSLLRLTLLRSRLERARAIAIIFAFHPLRRSKTYGCFLSGYRFPAHQAHSTSEKDRPTA
jgi:hypothetical protein